VGLHKIKKGLDLPISGAPAQTAVDAPAPRHVALLGADYVGMKPTMLVAEGDLVERGQPLFTDKKTPGVQFTAPGAGKVVAIHRGDRRAFQSLVIELNEGERSGAVGRGSQVRFASFTGKDVATLDAEAVRALLLESGLWTALRGRPYGRTANPEQAPHSIFVQAADSNPLAPVPGAVLKGREEDFKRGLAAVAKLTEGRVFVCKARGDAVPVPSDGKYRAEEFEGPHPSGTVGLHIHLLDPVDRNKVVWYLGYQDVAAIGHLFATGDLDLRRVVSVAGPVVRQPQLLRTRLGASTDDVAEGHLPEGETRLLSGSVLSGRKASGEVHGYLGRYHNQISALAEDTHREFLGWLAPGTHRFSATSAFVSAFGPKQKFDMTTTTYGSDRAMVPIGLYEKVMPMDLLPTFLLRSIFVQDVEKAEELGCLELEEEDLALCTFVCPGKTDWGPILRKVLTTIEKEG
jgi:Na+-transporting NADH:ubiquinone oxidoreductase subunit A